MLQQLIYFILVVYFDHPSNWPQSYVDQSRSTCASDNITEGCTSKLDSTELLKLERGWGSEKVQEMYGYSIPSISVNKFVSDIWRCHRFER